MKAVLTLALLLLIAGCINTGRYSHRSDSAPSHVPSELELSSAEPHFVTPSPVNSRPYSVFGKEYFPMQSGKGYEVEGEASWYGQKFHGHLTANGEIYNMYHMTAAHRTLPLPSFVRVTNLENGLSTIVKVNDRGPFHDNRVIDLSWAAAKKLDVLKTGTAQVKLQVIHVDKDGLITIGKGAGDKLESPLTEASNQHSQVAEVGQAKIAEAGSGALSTETSSVDATANNTTQINTTSMSAASTSTQLIKNKQDNTIAIDPEGQTKPVTEKATFIQVATLSNSKKVEELARGLSFLFHLPTHTPQTDAGTQIRLGPIQEGVDIQGILKQLRDKGFRDAFKVTASL